MFLHIRIYKYKKYERKREGYFMSLDIKDLKRAFGKRAREYAHDKEKTKILVLDAMEKAKNMDVEDQIDTFIENLKLLLSVTKDWSNGSYKEIPTGSIVIIIIGIIYFLVPTDLIADFLPAGFVDDAFVLGLVIRQVSKDLEKYKIWKDRLQAVQSI